MHWGWQCAAPNHLPDAGLGGVLKGALPGLGKGANVIFCTISCWQNVQICECFLEMPGFQCIGGGSVLPIASSCALGRAMRRKARCLALAEGPLHFFGAVSCWQNVTFCEGLLAMPSFQCIGGGSVPPPISCRTLG